MQDLLDLVRVEIAKHGLVLTQLSVQLTGCKAMLHQALSGGRNFSDRLFAKLVEEFKIYKHPELFKAWLAAYLQLRFPMDARKWLRAVNLEPTVIFTAPSREALTAQGIEAPLPDRVFVALGGDIRGELAKRRLGVLKYLKERKEQTVRAGDVASAGKCLASEARAALVWLQGRGWVDAHVEVGKKRIVTDDRVALVKGKLTSWKITALGEKTLASFV